MSSSSSPSLLSSFLLFVIVIFFLFVCMRHTNLRVCCHVLGNSWICARRWRCVTPHTHAHTHTHTRRAPFDRHKRAKF
jgi:hypothetical protein